MTKLPLKKTPWNLLPTSAWLLGLGLPFLHHAGGLSLPSQGNETNYFCLINEMWGPALVISVNWHRSSTVLLMNCGTSQSLWLEWEECQCVDKEEISGLSPCGFFFNTHTHKKNRYVCASVVHIRMLKYIAGKEVRMEWSLVRARMLEDRRKQADWSCNVLICDICGQSPALFVRLMAEKNESKCGIPRMSLLNGRIQSTLKPNLFSMEN